MAGVTFDGVNRLMILDTAKTSLDIKKDIYSGWKSWCQDSDNIKYAQALEVVGGDSIVDDSTITPYFYLKNGWMIRPYEGNHVLTVTGIILVEDSAHEPFTITLGSYNVSIRSIVPLKTETVNVATGSGLSTEQDNILREIQSNVDTVETKVDTVDTVVDTVPTKTDLKDILLNRQNTVTDGKITSYVAGTGDNATTVTVTREAGVPTAETVQ